MDFANTAFSCLFAQAAAPEVKSTLAWMFESLGWFYSVAIPLAGLLVFIGACLVVTLSKRPALIASFLVFLPLPVLIGFYGSIQGMIAAMSTLAASPAAPFGAEVAGCVSRALFTSFFSLFVTAPSYLVLAIGLFVRTLLLERGKVPFESTILP